MRAWGAVAGTCYPSSNDDDVYTFNGMGKPHFYLDYYSQKRLKH